MDRQIKKALETLREGLDTTLNSGMPYEQMDAALKLLEEKFTPTNQKRRV